MNQKQFFNVYQPIVDARDGSLSGVEVLLRWQHPVAGLIIYRIARKTSPFRARMNSATAKPF